MICALYVFAETADRFARRSQHLVSTAVSGVDTLRSPRNTNMGLDAPFQPCEPSLGHSKTTIGSILLFYDNCLMNFMGNSRATH